MLMDFVSAALGVGGLLSNIYSNEQNQANFDRQQKFAEYQYQDMKRYNSPAEQAKRLRAGGFNPALTFGGDTGMASAVSQPSPNPQQPLDLSGLSSLSDSIALNDSQRDKNQSEIQINKLRANGLELENMLNQKFAPIERDEGVKKLKNDVIRSYNEGLLLAAQGDYYKAMEKLSKAEEFMNYALGGKYHQEMLNAGEDFKWISSKARAYISHLNHQNRMLDAQGGLFGSQADLNRLDYGVRSDPQVLNSLKETFTVTLNKLKADKKVSDNEAQYLEYLGRKAEKEADSYYYFMVADRLIKVGLGVADIMALTKRLKALDQLSGAASKNAETRQKRLEEEINTYIEENTYTYKNGKRVPKEQKQTGRRRKRF